MNSTLKILAEKLEVALNKNKKKEGLVIVPPFGYIKKDSGEIVVDEERAEIVRLAYKLYLEGYGYKKIAQHLTDHGYKTPSWYRKQDTGMEYQPGKKWVGESTWSDRTISRMIRNDAYKGTLRCGTTERSIIYRYRRYVPKEKHFVHKNYYPVIIDKKTWDLAQAVRKNRISNNVRASRNNKIHRYAGLLECADCGACFVAKKRKAKTGIYVEYVCNAYHRFGTSLCTSHRIKEDELDDMIYAYLHRLKDLALDNLKKVDRFIQDWNERKRDFTKTINKVQDEILALKEDMKAYAKQLARELITEDLFQELTQETKERIELLEQQLVTLDEAKEINNNARLTMQNSYDILTTVLDEKKITNAQMQMLINKVCIKENEDKTLSLDVKINMPFKHHLVISNSFTEDTSSWANDPSVEDTIIDLINVFSAFDKIAA